ncbi:hypothetical protein [Streptomyces sp. HUAS TT20]|uniref:hypothetical protein n=1 Tax=Streptomyces sp. HUAS TT20 TaxID=3447509 RepID=UPI0021D999BD|nr:hypothetical protein [Streptomyces sp. HUAS 15-9]UXY33214.1 hypothetical protein N8I87_43695 [Streptomyces sp. HUAS 15-9]
MFELILLIAIAYAGARGVEKVTGTENRRYDTPESRKTVEKVAASGPKDGSTTVVKNPGPTEPGGTFSAAAPRSAKVGGAAAYPLAVITETGSTMWKAVGEGYRERWPEIREEHRRKMQVKAEERQRKKEELEAKKKAEEAKAKAGPPPPYPPKPTEPPKTADPDAKADDPDTKEEPEETKDSPATAEAGTGIPNLPGGPYIDLNAVLEEAIRQRREAEAKAEEARKEAEHTRDRAATDKVLAAQKEAREAKEREEAAEERARAAEAKASEAKPAEPESPAGRRHLAVVPDPAQNGDLMSSPATVIPEIRTLDGLMNALTLTKAMCEMRSEEALAIAADDKALSDRLDQIEAEMADLEVDAKTRAEVDALRESIHTQSQAAAQYGAAAKDAGDFATAAAAAAYKSHGGIAEAVQSSPIEQAAQAGYYDR